MSDTDCSHSHYGYFKRILLWIGGTSVCKQCGQRIRLDGRTSRHLHFSLVAILFADFLLLGLISGFICAYILTLIDITVPPLFGTIVPARKTGTIRETLRGIRRYVLPIPLLAFLLVLLPVWTWFLLNPIPVVVHDIDTDILAFTQIDRDTTIDAMPILRQLPRLSSDDSLRLRTAYNQEYGCNPDVYAIAERLYDHTAPLTTCTFIDTTKLPHRTDDSSEGCSVYGRYGVTTTYLYALIIKLHCDFREGRYREARNTLSRTLHLCRLIGEAQVDLPNTMKALILSSRALAQVINYTETIESVQQSVEMIREIERYTFDKAILLNTLRKEHRWQLSLLSEISEQFRDSSVRQGFGTRFIWDEQETRQIVDHLWARQLTEVSLPPGTNRKIIYHETERISFREKGPLPLEYILPYNITGRTFAAAAYPDFATTRKTLIRFQRKRSYALALLALRKYQLIHGTLPGGGTELQGLGDARFNAAEPKGGRPKGDGAAGGLW